MKVTDRKIITRHRLREIIEAQVKVQNPSRIIYDDNLYILPSMYQVRKIILSSKVNQHVFQPDFFDCDDYAKVFAGEAALRGVMMGNMCVIAKGIDGPHKINMTVTDKERVWFYEPQNKTFYDNADILILRGVI